jgi:hypothetical protein
LFRRHLLIYAVFPAAIFLTGIFRVAVGQGFDNVIQSNGQVLADAGSTVRAMKRGSDGSYYILTKVGNSVSVYNPDGRLIDRIPNGASGGAVIKYASDIDVDSQGNLFVVDRGANAVLIFRNDGALMATVHVNLPVSVAALPGHQFAVLTLRPQRLVTIMDQSGKVVTSFGDLAEAGVDPATHDLVTLGKITGDPSGYIYFGFTLLPNPSIRKYDRYGSASYSASIDNSFAAPVPAAHDDRVQFSLNFTQMNFSSQFHTGLTVGSSGSVRFAMGMGMGLSGLMGGGPMMGGGGGGPIMGGGPMMGGGPIMAGSNFGSAGGAGGPPMGPASMGAEISGTGSLRNGIFHLRLGLGPSGPPSALKTSGNAAAPSDSTNNSQFNVGAVQDSGFQFAPSSADDYSFTTSSFDTAILSNLQLSSDTQSGNIGSADTGSNPNVLGTDLSMGISPGMIQPSMFAFGGPGFGGPGGRPSFGGPGGRPSFGGNSMPPGQLSQNNTFFSPPSGSFGSRAAGSGFDNSNFGLLPGHFGFGMSNVVGTVRINLDRNREVAEEPQTISVMALDPETGQLWVALGNRLVAFDKDGLLLETSAISAGEGNALHITGLIVERSRILIATETSGVLSFERRTPVPNTGAFRLAAQPVNPSRGDETGNPFSK